MWQEISIYIIGIVVVLYIGKQLYHTIKHPGKTKCNCGCNGCHNTNKDCHELKK